MFISSCFCWWNTPLININHNMVLTKKQQKRREIVFVDRTGLEESHSMGFIVFKAEHHPWAFHVSFIFGVGFLTPKEPLIYHGFWGPKDVNALAWVIRDLELLKETGTSKRTTAKNVGFVVVWFDTYCKLGKRDLKKWIRYGSQKFLKDPIARSSCSFSSLSFQQEVGKRMLPQHPWTQQALPDCHRAHCCCCSSHHSPPRVSSPPKQFATKCAIISLWGGHPPVRAEQTHQRERRYRTQSACFFRSMTTVTDENKLSFCFISWGTFVNSMVIIRIKNITKEKTNPIVDGSEITKRPIIKWNCIKPPNAGDIFYINCSCRIIWTN